jgi:hypothetical protein
MRNGIGDTTASGTEVNPICGGGKGAVDAAAAGGVAVSGGATGAGGAGNAFVGGGKAAAHDGSFDGRRGMPDSGAPGARVGGHAGGMVAGAWGCTVA